MSPSKCSGPNLSVSVNGNNQITNTGFSYDAAGNTTADGNYSYAYNAENEIKSAGGVNYTYDGDGLRVEKSSGTLYWRSYAGQVLEETDTSGNMQRDYVFLAGRRIAWRDSSGNVYYYFADAIGSTRAVTNSTGTTCFEADYYPYGQENDYTTSCSPTYKFVLPASRMDLRDMGGVYPERSRGKFDSETGNYYAYARYYNPRLGRFMSADPLGGTLANPQSLDRYSYVINNPESYVDPSGMDCQTMEWWDWFNGQLTGHGTGSTGCHQPPPVGECSGTWEMICLMAGDEYTWDTQWTGPPIFAGPGVIDGPATLGPAGPEQPQAPKLPCETGLGAGLEVGGDAVAGAGYAGAVATGGAGAGLFVGGSQHVSAGAYRSGGATVYAGSSSKGIPAQTSGSPVAVGGGVGASVGVFFTNATSATQLRGPFFTLGVSASFGAVGLGIQISNGEDAAGNSIWQFSVSWAPGFEWAGYGLTTSTRAAATGPACE